MVAICRNVVLVLEFASRFFAVSGVEVWFGNMTFEVAQDEWTARTSVVQCVGGVSCKLLRERVFLHFEFRLRIGLEIKTSVWTLIHRFTTEVLHHTAISLLKGHFLLFRVL